MTWKPDRAQIDATLDQLGVSSTPETRQLLGLLATDPYALYSSVSRLSESEVPGNSEIPDVDGLVDDYLKARFTSCTEPSVLKKSKAIGNQCKRLLAVLLRDCGQPVPLPELLLVNGLRSGTPRRLRELEAEHGSFKMHTYSKNRVQHYILDRPDPDVKACSRYWIKANLRESRMPAARRVLALLSAYVGQEVGRREVEYVLPELTSAGRGLARATSGEAISAISELRERGYEIADLEDGEQFSLRGLSGE